MKIKINCDSKETMIANLILTKHEDICDNELPSLIVTEFGKDIDDPNKWIINIPVFVFDTYNRVNNVSINVRTGITAGVLTINGAFGLDVISEDGEPLIFPSDILGDGEITVDDLKSINAIVVISLCGRLYHFCMSNAKIKFKPKTKEVSVCGTFDINGFNSSEFISDMIQSNKKAW